MSINKPKSEYNYNDWFNNYNEVHDQFGFLGSNKKKLGDNDWKAAHEYAKKKLKANSSHISAADRQRIGSDDRAAHTTMDSMDPQNSFNMSDMFGNKNGGGVGDMSLGLGDSYDGGQQQSSSQSNRATDSNKPVDEGSTEEDEPATDETDPNALADGDGDGGGNDAAEQSLAENTGQEPPSQEGGGYDDPEGNNEGGLSKNKSDLERNSAKNALMDSAEAGVEAAETAAAAAETAAAVTETTAAAATIFSNPITYVVLIILVVVIFFLFQTLAAAYPNPENKSATGTCADVSDIKGPGKDDLGHSGYYQLPQNSTYYKTGDAGSPAIQQWGNKDTIVLVVNVGKTWSEAHPDQLFSVGDINSSDSTHSSHKVGVDVDIYNDNNKLFMSNRGHSPNSKYDKQLTIELAKAFIDTGAVSIIGYWDQSVIDAVNKYISDNNKKGEMQKWDDHDDHFHVRVKPGAYECKDGGGSVTDSGMPVDTGKGFHITSNFGPRTSPCNGCSSYHYGVDISISGSADAGLPVYSIADGEVIEEVQKTSGCGLRILGIKHSGNIAKTRYVHLSPTKGNSLVKRGDKVKKGQQIANLETVADSGHDSCSTGIHLHFETYKSLNGSPSDPEKLIDFKF